MKRREMSEPETKEKGGNKRIVKIVLSVLLAVLLIGGGITYASISRLWGGLGFDPNEQLAEEAPDPDAPDLPEVSFVDGMVSEVAKGDCIDILLLGVDSRNPDKFTGRTDVTMYLRIDKKSKELKLVSFMRDTLVAIDGHGHNRINAAYAFGSIELAQKTMLNSVGLRPDYYMVVNFFGMEDIINAFGGVEVEVKKNELDSMNTSIYELNLVDKKNKVNSVKAGLQTLNGRQAVGYMRVRKPGGDAGRIARQQTVLSAIFSKATHVSAGQLPGLVQTLAKYVRTDIPVGKILDIVDTVRGLNADSIRVIRYPDVYVSGKYKSIESVVQPKDFEAEIKKMHGFLAD